MNSRNAFVGIVLMISLISGCGGATKEPSPSEGGGEAAGQKILVDVIPTQASDRFREQMNRLGQLLSQESGLTVQVRIPTDYAAVVEAMRFGKSDVAFFGPFTYVVANSQSGAKAFITQNIKGKPFYHSYGIVLKESPIQEMNDQAIATLKGRTIALGDPSSTSSSQIPQFVMQNAGLDREKDVKLVFTGAHDAVLKAVTARKADIGFVDSAILEGSLAKKFPEDYAKVRVVYTSMPLYQYPWAHRRDLDPTVVVKLRQAFLKITDPEVLEPFGADSFVLADDEKYGPVRDAARALGVKLEQYKLDAK